MQQGTIVNGEKGHRRVQLVRAGNEKTGPLGPRMEQEDIFCAQRCPLQLEYGIFRKKSLIIHPFSL